MTEEGPRSWSGPAITAKFFWPAGVFVFVGILVVPVHDFFTALWFFLVVLPLGVAAVWLFVGVGQVLPCVEGLLYRRWAKWKMVRWQEGLEVKGVLPFFGALVVNGEVRVYFLLEPENRDLIGPAGRVGPSRDVAGAPARCERHRALWSVVFVLLGALASSVSFFWQALSPANTRGYSAPHTLADFYRRYSLAVVGASVVYLFILIGRKRLRERDLNIALFIVGVGVAYLILLFFRWMGAGL